MSVIDEVKDRIDIIDVIGETVKLRKSGKNYSGFCPFHPNTRTPAFAVFPDSGTWRCFGACNEGGDVFSFVMKKEGWDFSETLRILADRAGVELKPRTPEMEAIEETHGRLRELLEAAVMYYRHNLIDTAEGEPILEYLHKRGFQDSAMESFEIGFAPKGWEGTLGYLSDKGYSTQEIVDAGMVSERETGGYYDRFRNRIMIPIRDGRGRMAGFGARVVDPDDVPKFLNSPQTVLFDKGRMLYGLDKARKSIRAADQSVIVEGYMDVIGLHQAGFANAVSPMGTALTEQQLRLLKRYSRRIVLALDADLAGSQATLRGLTVAREAFDRSPDPVFDARGLVSHEGRLDAEIRVITLPEGTDPDEVVVEDPQAWPQLLENSKTVVEYVLGVLSADRDIEDPKTKADIARNILPLIEDVVDPVEREAYRQQLARRLMVDERALLEWKPRAVRRRRKKEAVDEVPAASRDDLVSESPIEHFCMGVFIYDPELLYRIDRQLQSLELERVSPQDFTRTEHQVIFQAVREALAQDEVEPARFWREMLAPTILDLADALLAQVVDLDMTKPKVLEEIIANFLRLRKRNLERRLTHLRFQLQEAQEYKADSEDAQKEVWHYTREVQRFASMKDRLDRALSRQGGQMLSTPHVMGR
jgi:DNA primase